MTTKEKVKQQRQKSLKLLINKMLKQKPSEILGDALDAVVAFEKQPNFMINMGDWHAKQLKDYSDYDSDHVCTACLGGAAILNKLGLCDRKIIDSMIKDANVTGNGMSKTNKIFFLISTYSRYNGKFNIENASNVMGVYESALDCLRKGEVDGAFEYINDLRVTAGVQGTNEDYYSINGVEGKALNRKMVQYESPEGDIVVNQHFKDDIKELIKDLKAKGV